MHELSFMMILDHYLDRYPKEAETVERVRALVEHYEDAFYRTCHVGHITGSAWIVSADHRQCLLTHHRKLDRWLQLGGHADGEEAVQNVALREAQEESGMHNFTVVPIEGRIMPFDIDIHPIPATAKEPAHAHYDLRYLLVAEPNQTLQISAESKDLRWFEWETVLEVANEESIRRMMTKAHPILEQTAGHTNISRRK